MLKSGFENLAREIRTSIKAGAVYFAAIFAVGFILGAARTWLVADAAESRRLSAVLIELPLMLAASWLVCGSVIRALGVTAAPAARAAMGGTSFVLLMLAEMGVGWVFFGRTPVAHVLLYREASYAVGLAAQVAFALMPMVRSRRPSAT